MTSPIAPIYAPPAGLAITGAGESGSHASSASQRSSKENVRARQTVRTSAIASHRYGEQASRSSSARPVGQRQRSVYQSVRPQDDSEQRTGYMQGQIYQTSYAMQALPLAIQLPVTIFASSQKQAVLRQMEI